MNTIYILLPLAVLLSLVGLGMMIWSIRRGQFDDMEGPAHRILFEDDQEMIPGKKAEKTPKTDLPPNKHPDN
ncbi:MAG: cbb3-type cytochrome oxidase assembly protein CcoS [Magnetococcales bacterium]|nr:cbb3-type cytochrome oxidase assembly protein CcoS [Magnetococcales bacterium]